MNLYEQNRRKAIVQSANLWINFEKQINWSVIMSDDWETWKLNLMKELNGRDRTGEVRLNWHLNGDEAAVVIESVIKTCPNILSFTLNGTVRQGGDGNPPYYGAEPAKRPKPKAVPVYGPEVPGYEMLRNVLEQAYDQAARGKGKERHANNLPFHEQPMQMIARQTGLGFITGQAMKKIGESHGMDKDAAVRELLGAIVYAAGAVIFLAAQGETPCSSSQSSAG